MNKYLNALSDLFTDDVFKLLIDKKFKEAKAVMKTLGMKKFDIDKIIKDSKKIKWLNVQNAKARWH